MCKDISFAFDTNKYCINPKSFMITGSYLEYLLAFFNSKLFKFCFSDDFPELQGNSKEVNKFALTQIPVKEIDQALNAIFTNIISENFYKNNTSLDKAIDQKIDNLIYNHYGLTNEEISIVEKSVS